jgi:hypothetical protein
MDNAAAMCAPATLAPQGRFSFGTSAQKGLIESTEVGTLSVFLRLT